MSIGLYDLIGTDTGRIYWWQMSIRALVIFLLTLLIIRLGSSRIYSKFGSLDIVLAIILGSTLSRTLTGNAPFIPTLAAALILVLVHLLLVMLALSNNTIGTLVKGKEIQLVKNGEILHQGLKKARLTENDLMESIRLQGGVESIKEVKSAYLERNGNVSIIT